MTFSILWPLQWIHGLKNGLKERKSLRLVIEKAKVSWVITYDF